jgi:hypothetical protein
MGILRTLFGGSVSGGKVDWDELRKMMEYQADLNRYTDVGLFGGSEWEEGEDGQWTRRQTINPALQSGLDRIMGRTAPGGMGDPYSAPSQFSQLLDAKMANQMQRHGIGQGGAAPDPSVYGPPSASQPGRNPFMQQSAPMQTQASPQLPAQSVPGGGGGQPSQMGGPLRGAGGDINWDVLRQMFKR